MEKIDSKYDVNAYVESRIGGRNENQDSYGYADTPFGFLVVVCDGMGGLNGGKTASTIAVSTIVDYISKCEESGSIPVLLSKAITEANREIIATASSDMSLKGMGTTATVLLINENAAYAAHVGDSRIYQVRNGKKIFRTFDHSMVFELVKKKVITEEQARLSAQSNIITRALGIKDEVIVDTATLHYRKGDRFVLCSDGFHSVMTEKDFLREIGAKGKLNMILDNLAEKIDNIGKENGSGHDNLTAAVVEVKTTTPVEKKKCITFSTAIAVVLSIIITLLCYEHTAEEIVNPGKNYVKVIKHSNILGGLTGIDFIYKQDSTKIDTCSCYKLQNFKAKAGDVEILIEGKSPTIDNIKFKYENEEIKGAEVLIEISPKKNGEGEK